MNIVEERQQVILNTVIFKAESLATTTLVLNEKNESPLIELKLNSDLGHIAQGKFILSLQNAVDLIALLRRSVTRAMPKLATSLIETPANEIGRGIGIAADRIVGEIDEEEKRRRANKGRKMGYMRQAKRRLDTGALPETRAQIVAEIQVLKSQGHDFFQIAEIMNKRGVKTVRHGKKWTDSNVRYHFDNPDGHRARTKKTYNRLLIAVMSKDGKTRTSHYRWSGNESEDRVRRTMSRNFPGYVVDSFQFQDVNPESSLA